MIKILILAANPKDTERLRLEEEVLAIREKLQLADLRDLFVVEQEWAVRVTDLAGHLLHHRPQIVHFSGHGSKAGEIILEDANGNSKAVSPKSISQLFKTLQDDIQCVVLNSCYSQIQAEGIVKSIPCVIGMTQVLGDKSAVAFVAGFYQALGYKRSIQKAFDLGSGEIDLEGLSDADVPKLLTGDGIIAENTFIKPGKFPEDPERPPEDLSRVQPRKHDLADLRKVIQKKYSLTRILGRGHDSLVILAFDHQLERFVTIKSLTNPDAASEFDNAVRRVAKITKHTNIMSIYGAWLSKRPHYYVREYAEGHSLRIELERRGKEPLPIDFIQQVLAAVGNVMIFAQDFGVKDIDIKSENIIIERLQVKLDLGLSSNYNIKLSPEIGDREMVRKEGYVESIKSNVIYFPPELFYPSNVYSDDPDFEKENQYRLGILGYEMLSATEQFDKEIRTRSQILPRLRDGSTSFLPWPPVETMRQGGCPKFMSLAIDKMIAPDSRNRFPRLSEAVDAIAHRDLNVEVARDSFRRILNDNPNERKFFRTFYNRFLDYCPAAAADFESAGFPSRDALNDIEEGNPIGKWPIQFVLLKEAIVLLFAFNILKESQEPTILSRIAEKHKKFSALFYDSFVKALVETVLEFDKRNHENELKSAWERSLKPGIDYMKQYKR